MSKTKSVTKSAPVKTKAAPKAKVKATTPLFYAALLGEALSGKYGQVIQRFYVNATKYHLSNKTTFPRERLAAQPLLSQDDAVAFLRKHEKTSLPPGDRTGQRLFDQMMVQSAQK